MFESIEAEDFYILPRPNIIQDYMVRHNQKKRVENEKPFQFLQKWKVIVTFHEIRHKTIQSFSENGTFRFRENVKTYKYFHRNVANWISSFQIFNSKFYILF